MTDYIVDIVSDQPRVIDVTQEGAPSFSIDSGERVIDVIVVPADPPAVDGLEDLILSYGVSGELIAVERVPSGLETTLAYDGSRLVGVTDYRGTRVLGYDGDQLTSVTWAE